MQQQVRSGSQPVRLLHTTLDLGLLPSFYSVTRVFEGSLRSGNTGSLPLRLRPVLRLLAIHRTTQSQCALGHKTSITCCRHFLAVPPTHAGHERQDSGGRECKQQPLSINAKTVWGKSASRWQNTAASESMDISAYP
jgi:hypothetical protein